MGDGGSDYCGWQRRVPVDGRGRCMKSGRLTVGLANLRMLFCIILTIALGGLVEKLDRYSEIEAEWRLGKLGN